MSLASTPYLDSLFASYPHTELLCYGEAVGLPEGQVGRGLGTQIVRTLIQGELGGTIDWHTLMGNGTEVTIEIPLRYIGRSAG